ncbi:hypothetical protein D3Z36_02760 [Lachnospiraceae bacterium]|nr:hypothetical protein [Lachnospiraceae bacterium]
MTEETVLFASAVDLSRHPMKYEKSKRREQYYLILEYFVKKQLDNKFTAARLQQYRAKLQIKDQPAKADTKITANIQSMINSRVQPWRKKYRYWLMCDIALIVMDGQLIDRAAEELTSYMTKRQQQKFAVLLRALKDDSADVSALAFAEKMVEQYRKNRRFGEQILHRYIVTANMSAGKSTLINALIGKPLARTSQEVCTGNACYLYNKVFEDGRIHLENDTFTINAAHKELSNFSWDRKTSIAAYFHTLEHTEKRLCIIDTPGVNSAVNRNHGKISREALSTEAYEKAIYVLNANKLGTEEEIAHLRWVSENVPKEKMIFVLNKLDDFKAADDNIQDSIEGVKNDLAELGFERPLICPISAYFALLIKMKAGGAQMTEDEQDEYALYLKKFMKPAYDLSKYYENIQTEAGDSEILSMSKKCGLYGLEKILYGGTT